MPFNRLRDRLKLRGSAISIEIDGEKLDIPADATVDVDIKLGSGGRQTAATPSGAGDRPPTPPKAPVAPR